MVESTKPTLFICYSHTDLKYREQFTKFLQMDKLKESMTIFSDAAIEPGDEWQKTILERLQQATAALVLVSQDFIISPFIQQVELRELLAGYIRKGLRLFLVPVRSTIYQGTYLERFQWARPPDKPLSLLTPEQQEEAMVAICQKIAAELADTKPDAATAEHTIACLESVPKLDLPSVYEVEEPIGEGEFARCFKARDRLLEKTVIIKVLNTPLSQDSPGYDKYVRSASRLTHRNILNLLFSQANKLPHFIVTPAVGDATLEKRLAAGRMKMADAVDLTIKLASTLAYAHSKACVHGRLRPSEVRFDREDEPVLSGFRTVDALRDPPPAPCDRRLTLEEFLSSSPEQRESGIINARTDQYQLGLLAYEMISGAPPVRASESTWSSPLNPATARALLQPRPLADFVPGCEPRVSDAVMRMLSVDPVDRWETLDQVIAVLRTERAILPCVEEAKASYRRCAQDDRFYETLYNRLFETTPAIRTMFAGRSMAQQYQVLRDALWLLLSFKQSEERGEPTILSGIARTHARFEPAQFELFQEAVLEAVAQHDPDGPGAVAAWREAMNPGIEYLKAKAGKAAFVSA